MDAPTFIDKARADGAKDGNDFYEYCSRMAPDQWPRSAVAKDRFPNPWPRFTPEHTAYNEGWNEQVCYSEYLR